MVTKILKFFLLFIIFGILGVKANNFICPNGKKHLEHSKSPYHILRERCPITYCSYCYKDHWDGICKQIIFCKKCRNHHHKKQSCEEAQHLVEGFDFIRNRFLSPSVSQNVSDVEFSNDDDVFAIKKPIKKLIIGEKVTYHPGGKVSTNRMYHCPIKGCGKEHLTSRPKCPTGNTYCIRCYKDHLNGYCPIALKEALTLDDIDNRSNDSFNDDHNSGMPRQGLIRDEKVTYHPGGRVSTNRTYLCPIKGCGKEHSVSRPICPTGNTYCTRCYRDHLNGYCPIALNEALTLGGIDNHSNDNFDESNDSSFAEHTIFTQEGENLYYPQDFPQNPYRKKTTFEPVLIFSPQMQQNREQGIQELKLMALGNEVKELRYQVQQVLEKPESNSTRKEEIDHIISKAQKIINQTQETPYFNLRISQLRGEIIKQAQTILEIMKPIQENNAQEEQTENPSQFGYYGPDW